MEKILKILTISFLLFLILVPSSYANDLDSMDKVEIYNQLRESYNVSTNEIDDLNYEIIQVIEGGVDYDLIIEWIEEYDFDDLNRNIKNINLAIDSNQPLEEILQSIKNNNSFKIFNKYRIEYYTEKTSTEKVWMPIPKNWDNHGTNEIEILNIEPEPTELYTDEHGNKIAYWKNNSDEKNEYKIEFEITISNINHDISKEDYDINYDETSEIYKKYTSSRNKTQSDAPEIIEKANEIVGDTLDPVQKARKILKWTSTNIESDGNVPYDLPDALSVLEYQKGHCGAFVNIFVALSRASGIPARNVSLIHHPDDNQFKSGSHSDTFWGHLIAEIYLQDYGWVQIDIVRGDWFGKIEENIIILSKGNEFELKNAEFETKDIAFHLPLKSRADGSLVQFKSYIEVEKLN